MSGASVWGGTRCAVLTLLLLCKDGVRSCRAANPGTSCRHTLPSIDCCSWQTLHSLTSCFPHPPQWSWSRCALCIPLQQSNTFWLANLSTSAVVTLNWIFITKMRHALNYLSTLTHGGILSPNICFNNVLETESYLWSLFEQRFGDSCVSETLF